MDKSIVSPFLTHGVHIAYIQWPYVRNGWSDTLYVWF